MPQIAEPGPAPLPKGLEPLHVLAVEDSSADARLLRESVADAGPMAKIELSFVRTLADAEAAIKAHHYDCVLLDLGLPDAVGTDNVQRLRAANSRQTIVIMTGLDSEEAALGNLQRGAQDYLVKGRINGTELVRVIRRAIERNRVLSEVDRLREEQYFQATHDALTGLPNRQLFLERAQRIFGTAERHGGTFALGNLDLDGFKAVNDQHGHAVGDSLLRLVGRALHDAMRDTDTVARVGGDEFLFLLSPLDDSELATRVVTRLRESISAIRTVDQRGVNIGASIGLAFYPRHARTLDLLMIHADQAMYEAKREGRAGREAAGSRNESPAKSTAP